MIHNKLLIIYHYRSTARFTACSFVWKWSGGALAWKFATDRPFSKFWSDKVTSWLWDRSIGHTILLGQSQ